MDSNIVPFGPDVAKDKFLKRIGFKELDPEQRAALHITERLYWFPDEETQPLPTVIYTTQGAMLAVESAEGIIQNVE